MQEQEQTASNSNLLEFALVQYFRHSRDDPLHYVRDADRYTAVYDMRDWFSDEIDQPLELRALSFVLPARRVLDIGAGVGRHALALKQRGIAGADVVALDIMRDAVALMRLRGIEHAYCVDVLAPDLYDDASSGVHERHLQLATPSTAASSDRDHDHHHDHDHLQLLQLVADRGGALFDVVLLLSDTIGFVGTVDGARDLLRKLHAWVAPGGQVLLDCSDIELEIATNPLAHADFVTQQPTDVYVGQSLMHFEYRGVRGASFNWLYLSVEKLRAIAAECGWRCFLLQREGSEYLVELRRDDE
jgi:SAM-dependent methyltransferase